MSNNYDYRNDGYLNARFRQDAAYDQAMNARGQHSQHPSGVTKISQFSQDGELMSADRGDNGRGSLDSGRGSFDQQRETFGGNTHHAHHTHHKHHHDTRDNLGRQGDLGDLGYQAQGPGAGKGMGSMAGIAAQGEGGARDMGAMGMGGMGDMGDLGNLSNLSHSLSGGERAVIDMMEKETVDANGQYRKTFDFEEKIQKRY